jgi:hypothetical protein
MITRRKLIVNGLAGGAMVTSPIPVAFVEAALSQSAEKTLTFFNSEQEHQVTNIVDNIIPVTDTPSASQVGVVQFVDFMLVNWYAPEESRSFLVGLRILATQLNTLTPQKSLESLDHLAFSIGGRTKPELLTYRTLKELTLIGYYTSREGRYENLHTHGPIGEMVFEPTGAPGGPIVY